MQFVEQHLSKHHFFHAPHRWFLAVLLSPLHAAEMHYKNRYHLRFEHAKKLFFFDMLLVASAIFLAIATLFWHFYDPTVRSLVGLKVEHSTERIKTGTKISYSISYINHSDVVLENPILSFKFPNGFVMDTSTFPNNFNRENSSLTLSPLAPGAHGSITFTGTLFGTPDTEYDTLVRLSYLQEGETDRESVISRIITSPRETPLLLDWNIGDFILAQGSVPFTLDIGNREDQTLDNIHILLPSIPGIQFEIKNSSNVSTEGNRITISQLAAHTSSSIQGNIHTALEAHSNSVTFDIHATIRANNEDFPQKKISKTLQVLRPSLEANALWKKENATAKTFERVPLQISIKNTNNYSLKNLNVDIAMPSGVDTFYMTQNGTVKNNVFSSNKKYFPKLAELKSGETLTLDLSVPIAGHLQGTDVTLTLSPEIYADIPQIEAAHYKEKIHTQALKIASTLSLRSELRYYTNEGDQLGRGPLPPQIGNETKYFATLVLSNSTSGGENATVSALLSPGFEWGEKSSVSFGKDVVYDAKTRKITWNASSIPAHSEIGISFALSFTPTETDLGKTPLALQNISASATDSFTQISLFASSPALDISLPNDPIGKAKGIQVIP